MNQLLEFFGQAIFGFGNYTFTVGNFLLLGTIIPFAMFLFWVYKRLSKKVYSRYDIPEDNQTAINRFFKTVMYWVSGIAVVRAVGLPLPTVMGYELWRFGEGELAPSFQISNIVYAILLYILGKTLVWVVLELLNQYFNREKTDKGARYAINQIAQYVIYTAITLSILDALGFELSVLWAGAAALLVGFGLGLQQLFNDLVSGILIMIEGSVQVGDVVEVDNFVGTVLTIGIRASKIRTRDNIAVIVPNSHLVMEGVVNWSHISNKKRFSVSVGVAYGSNTELVKTLLKDVALRHEKILDFPDPFIRFVNFGDSSLDFELHFWTYNLEGIQDILSDLRFAIDASFRENKVEIPFPQRDLWVRNHIQVGE